MEFENNKIERQFLGVKKKKKQQQIYNRNFIPQKFSRFF